MTSGEKIAITVGPRPEVSPLSGILILNIEQRRLATLIDAALAEQLAAMQRKVEAADELIEAIDAEARFYRTKSVLTTQGRADESAIKKRLADARRRYDAAKQETKP